jgi:hypothetical protein
MTTLRIGRVYKIWTTNNPQIYIGSTFKSLEKRLQKHEGHFIEESAITSRKILQFGDYKISLLEEIEVENRDQLKWRERFWLEKLKEEGFSIVNKLKPIISEEERKQEKRDYRKKHRDEMLIKSKIYYEKEKEKIKKRASDWYVANKEKVKSRQDERITCDICQCSFRRGEISAHNKSLKHKKKLESFK